MFLVIDKDKAQVHYIETTKGAAELIGCESYDIHHEIKGKGRYDSADRQWVVIATEPEE